MKIFMLFADPVVPFWESLEILFQLPLVMLEKEDLFPECLLGLISEACKIKMVDFAIG